MGLHAGVLVALVAWARLGIGRERSNGVLALPPGAAALASTATGAAPFGLTPLFLAFLKIGSVLFGSGYVLLAFLRADLVVRRGWLTESQLFDAVAVGQITPGPVFTIATCRLRPRRLVGRGGRDGRDLPPRLRVRGPEPAARPADPTLARGRRLPRRPLLP
jgi:hypothetical protein